MAQPFGDYLLRESAAYAEHRPTYPVELVAFLSGLAGRRELAWDCGCGPGQLSVLLAERFERVIATDVSAAQLGQAADHPRVRYVCAAAEASALPDASADLAVAAQAAHWFDLAAYYGEVRRVTRPGGAVALVTYGLTVIEPKIDHVVGGFYSGPLASYWSPERRHVEEGYRSLRFPFAEIEAPRLDIRREWTLAEFVGYVETWSAVRAMVKAEGAGRLDQFRHELGGAWCAAGEKRTIRWPLSIRAARL